ncbi:MAG: hypothetical protein AAF467_21795 [Actinomycetota bacterium]
MFVNRSSGSASAGPRPSAPFHDPAFDLGFVVGIPLVALASGAVVVAIPAAFPIVLALDIWFLGYHHVISTFIRLLGDPVTRRESVMLWTGLPVLVVVGVVAMAALFGTWALATTYFYWQWWHYTRQSRGIAMLIDRGTSAKPDGGSRLFEVVFYALPIAGVLSRSADGPTDFIGTPFRPVPIPEWVADASTVVAVALTAVAVVMVARRVLSGTASSLAAQYMGSHVVVFAVSYLLIDDITHGWLVVNIWHNAQYVAFVWLFHHRKAGATSSARSPLPIPHRLARSLTVFLAVGLVLSTLVYGLVAAALMVAAVPAIIVYQAINFHHYVVDSRIWQSRRPSMGEPSVAR